MSIKASAEMNSEVNISITQGTDDLIETSEWESGIIPVGLAQQTGTDQEAEG